MLTLLACFGCGLLTGATFTLLLAWFRWGRPLKNATALLQILMGPSKSLEEIKAKMSRQLELQQQSQAEAIKRRRS